MICCKLGFFRLLLPIGRSGRNEGRRYRYLALCMTLPAKQVDPQFGVPTAVEKLGGMVVF